jgi:hypothetical protein
MGGIVSQSPMSSFFRRDDKKPTPSEFIDAVRKLVDCESLPSDKRANNIEAFLALCHQCQFQMDVLHSILTDQAARLAFLEFLRDEYYVGAYYYFEEAVGYLEYEINSNIGVAEDEANGLNLRRLTNHEYEVRKSRWRSSHKSRYHEIIVELSTIGLKRFMPSEYYAHFIATKKGLGPVSLPTPISTFRDAGSSTLRRNSSSVPLMRSLSTMSLSTARDASRDEWAGVDFVPTVEDETDNGCGNLVDCPWLFDLVTKMERCGVGMIVIANASSFPIVAANHVVQSCFNYPRSELLGSKFDVLTEFGNSDFSLSLTKLSCLSEYHQCIEKGDDHVVEISFLGRSRRPFTSVVALHPVYENELYRYMVILFVNQKDNALNTKQEEFLVNEDMVRSFQAHFLCEVSGLLPKTVDCSIDPASD